MVRDLYDGDTGNRIRDSTDSQEGVDHPAMAETNSLGVLMKVFLFNDNIPFS